MEKLWSKSFIQLTVSMLLLFTGFYLLLPTMPLFVKELGGSESQVGLLIGVFTLTAVVCRPIVGGLLDRYGRRVFMLWGLALFVVAMYAYEWVGGIVALLALRILHGGSWAFATTAVGTAVTDLIPASRRGEGMGWYGMAMTLAMAVGPLFGTWIVQNRSFGDLFLIATGFSCAALVLAFLTKTPFQPRQTAGKMQFFEKSILSVTVAIFFLAVAYGGITTFLPLFAGTIDVNPGTFFLVYAVALTVIRPIAGKLSDRYGEAWVIVPALVVTFSSLLILGFANGLIGVIVSAVLYGIGFGAAQPALQSTALRLVLPERRGVANASFFTAFDLGIGLGAILLGWISQYTGYQVLFTVSAVSVVVSLLIFTVYVRRILRVQPSASA